MPRPSRQTAWSALFLGTLGASFGLLTVALTVDLALAPDQARGILQMATRSGLGDALGALPEVLAATLGIALTVVAIVVQLASQRYSPKIVDLFMRDAVNIGIFSFMVVSCIYVLIVPIFATTSPLPHVALATALLLAVANYALLLPYFAHVFAFLQPTNIITQIEADASRAIASAHTRRKPPQIEDAQTEVINAVDRIADNCVAAIGQHDRNIALHCVRTLEGLTRHCLVHKDHLPPQWHAIPPDHFFALSREFYDEIVRQKLWVEAKALMEFEHILKRALGPMDELVTQLASSSRAIALQAVEARDEEALAITVRFFNTYMRHALNAKNVRACYNILYQYRLLAEAVMKPYPHVAVQIVEHLVYYGRTANSMGLPFVTVTAAHDVRVLCEHAFSTSDADVKALLHLFLTLDQRSEAKIQELALIGVRKAQSMLGAFFLAHGATPLAEQIRHDMNGESPARLLATRDAILSISSRKFWEITDRGINFDYVEDELRPYINRFFEPLLRD